MTGKLAQHWEKEKNKLREFVVMERVHNPPFPSVVFDSEKQNLLVRDAIGELGIFGAMVALGRTLNP